MKKLIAIAVMAAVPFAIAGSPVLAQTLTPQGSTNIVMADHSMRASKLIGTTVLDDQGQKIGTIIDVLVKDKGTEPTLILSVGDYTGEGHKMVAAPLSHIKLDHTKVMLPGATKQVFASMPAYTFQGLEGGGG